MPAASGLADVTMSPSASDGDPRCQWHGNCEQVDHFRHRIGQFTDLVLNTQIIDETHTNRRGDPYLITTCLASPAVHNIS
jgi:hypothetical protein